MNERLTVFFQKLCLVLVVALLLFILFTATNLILTVFAGMLLAILWRGIARWLQDKTPLSYKAAVPLVIFIHLGLLVLFGYFAAPNLMNGIERMVDEAPRIAQQLEERLRASELGSEILDTFKAKQQNLSGTFMRWSQLMDVASTTLNVTLDVLLILVFAIFFISDPSLYIRGTLHLVSKERRNRINQVLHCLIDTLFRWFIGKIVDMSSIFIMTAIGLWLLDMPLIFTFATIAFLLSFIPNIGPILSVIPPLAFAVVESPTKALYVALLYLGIQLFETYFITPSVQKQASFSPPVLLLFIQFLLGTLAGILGLFLATPILVMGMVITKMLYVEDYLGDYSLPTCEDNRPEPVTLESEQT